MEEKVQVPEDISGWFLKKGKLVKNLKRRFCVIHVRAHTLTYYSDEQCTHMNGKIDLSIATKVKICEKPVLSFEIETPTRTWWLQAEEQEILNKFVDTISFILDTNREFYSYKQGELWKKGKIVKNWKKRYFVLCPRHLLYFVDKDDADRFIQAAIKLKVNFQVALRKLRNVQGTIPLRDASVQVAGEVQPGEYCFTIQSHNRLYFLVGESESDIQTWASEVQQEIDINSDPILAHNAAAHVTAELQQQRGYDSEGDEEWKDEPGRGTRGLTVCFEEYLLQTKRNPAIPEEYRANVLLLDAKDILLIDTSIIQCNPYLRIYFHGSPHWWAESMTRENTTSPLWHESLDVACYPDKPPGLVFECYSEDRTGTDKLIGTARLAIDDNEWSNESKERPQSQEVTFISPQTREPVGTLVVEVRLSNKTLDDKQLRVHTDLMKEVTKELPVAASALQEKIVERETKEMMERLARAFLEIATKGESFLKFGRYGRPHLRQVTIDFEKSIVDWTTGSLPISKITSINAGKTTPIFNRRFSSNDTYHPDQCFSILTSNRSLDLMASTPDICRRWVSGFNALLEEGYSSSSSLPVVETINQDIKENKEDDDEEVNENFKGLSVIKEE